MNKTILLFFVFLSGLLFTAVFGNKVFATVGGPSYISQLSYDPSKNLVYYLRHDQSGMGCPPIINAIDITNGQSRQIKTCQEVFDQFFEKYTQENDTKYQEFIADTYGNSSYIGSVSLKKNNIDVSVQALADNFMGDDNWKISTDFIATIKQDGKELGKVNFTGCNREQPHVFEGYMVRDSDVMLMLISNKNNCFEGGYVGETAHLIKGVKYYDENIIRGYKGSEPTEPNMGNVVVYASSGNDNIGFIDTKKEGILIMLAIFIIGLIIGRITKKAIR